jgi:hypothetical protein
MKKRTGEKKRRAGLYLPPKLYEDLQIQAVKAGVSVSEHITRILRAHQERKKIGGKRERAD